MTEATTFKGEITPLPTVGINQDYITVSLGGEEIYRFAEDVYTYSLGPGRLSTEVYVARTLKHLHDKNKEDAETIEHLKNIKWELSDRYEKVMQENAELRKVKYNIESFDDYMKLSDDDKEHYLDWIGAKEERDKNG